MYGVSLKSSLFNNIKKQIPTIKGTNGIKHVRLEGLGLLTAVLLVGTAAATPITEDVQVEGHYLRLGIPPAGGVLKDFGLLANPVNHAGPNGLLLEGFGVGSYYVPNRRLNEKTELLTQPDGVPAILFAYDCDGPNIRGLHVERLIEAFPNETSLRITWTIENRGAEQQWVAPWVRNDTAVGGTVSKTDLLIAPTLEGVRRIERVGYFPMARNWVSVTDPATKETLYAVFDADHLHSVLGVWGPDQNLCGFQAAFVPRLLKPGETWTTKCRLNFVRGLDHVDFATDEFAAQVDYASGKLVMLLAAVKTLDQTEIHARLVAANGRVWRLATKRFSASPDRVIRCTYSWSAPADGAYELLAQLRRGDEPVMLGQDTASPHGGIDTQFAAGPRRPVAFEAWTDAPYALERGARTLDRTLAADGAVAAWFEPSLEKVFRDDVPRPQGKVDPTARLSLARNEYESFQIVFRPAEGRDLFDVSIHFQDLVKEDGGARIPAECLTASLVGYVPVRVPSNFEGPTGEWPDPLPRLPERFPAPGGRCTPVWVTLYASPDTPPGTYRSMFEVQNAGPEPLEFGLEVRVYDFTLPLSARLKTDFGISLDKLDRGGGDALRRAYLENALEHRVTLRELTQLPEPSPNFPAGLQAYQTRLQSLRQHGATTFCVPASLANAPDQLGQANAFVARNNLRGGAFVHLAQQPSNADWPALLQSMERWKANAPDIPVMVTTHGIDPFLPETLDRWAVHLPVIDTVNSGLIVKRILDGGEVWTYVNHAPPRPYGNFFVDFAGIEHRILFWQCAVLGICGMHYWNVNYTEPGQDPWKSLLDATPVNGDGFLVYPGADGPVNSIRWEIIRDGIEDYDYLMLFQDLRKRLEKTGGHAALLQRAAQVYNFDELVPSLVGFSRDPQVLLRKRALVAELIEEMRRALQ